MRHRAWVILVWASVLILALAGCGSEPEQLPEARPLLEEAANKIQTAATFRIQIDVKGYPVVLQVGDFELPLDTSLFFEFAQGMFAAPDKLHADTIQIRLGDLSATVEMIAVGQDQYMRSDLLTSNRWVKGEIISGFSPAALIAPEGGIASALDSIAGVEMKGKKDLDGLDVYHLHGTIQASSVYALTFGLIGTQNGMLAVDVYILTDERQVEQVIFNQPPPPDAAQQEPTTWTITLSAYNQPVEIVAPTLDEAG